MIRVLTALFALALLAAATAARADVVLHNVGSLASTGSVLFSFTGDATFRCSDGSVRTIPPDGQVTCGDGSVRTLLSNDALGCGAGSVHSVLGGTSVYCDGSVRSFFGDGSVRFVTVDEGARGSLCFTNVRVPGAITDGTSNTIAFGEQAGFRVTPHIPVTGGIQVVIGDGSVRTIHPDGNFCLGNTEIGDPYVGEISDGTSNTVLIGEDSRFDLCLPAARLGVVIQDGSSRTIGFGEAQSGICLTNVRVGADLAEAALPEPAPLGLLLAGLAALVAGRRQRAI
jgi:hypothetical protein